MCSTHANTVHSQVFQVPVYIYYSCLSNFLILNYPKFLSKTFLYTDTKNIFIQDRLFFPLCKILEIILLKKVVLIPKLMGIIFRGVSISLPLVYELTTKIVP